MTRERFTSMSENYRRQEIKRHWAEPGSRHDMIIRAVKFGLPI